MYKLQRLNALSPVQAIVMSKIACNEPVSPKSNKVFDAIYYKKVDMDDKNKTAMKVLVNDGKKAFINHVFTDEQGRKLDYAEMRSIYG